jgi:hypothetical protein
MLSVVPHRRRFEEDIREKPPDGGPEDYFHVRQFVSISSPSRFSNSNLIKRRSIKSPKRTISQDARRPANRGRGLLTDDDPTSSPGPQRPSQKSDKPSPGSPHSLLRAVFPSSARPREAHLNFDERVGLSPGIRAGALKGYFSGVRFVSLSHALRDTDKVLKTF